MSGPRRDVGACIAGVCRPFKGRAISVGPPPVQLQSLLVVGHQLTGQKSQVLPIDLVLIEPVQDQEAEEQLGSPGGVGRGGRWLTWFDRPPGAMYSWGLPRKGS